MVRKLKIITLAYFSLFMFVNTAFGAIQYYFSRSVYSEDYNYLPKILSNKDLAIYYSIYENDKRGNYQKSDMLASNLDNDILMGYMLYMRYMSPNYKTTFAELKTWLSQYNDLAVATAVLKLAKKKAKNSSQISSLNNTNSFYDRFVPIYLRHESFNDVTPIVGLNAYEGVKIVSNSNTKAIAGYLKKGKTLNAKNMLLSSTVRKNIGEDTYAHYSSVLAKSYFLDGRYALAIQWAKNSIAKHKMKLPEASFTLGLAYYAQGEYKLAAPTFQFLAKGPFSVDTISKGAYWYAKTSLSMGNIDNYYKGLHIASVHVYNFYGVLASEELGIKPKYAWTSIVGKDSSLNVLVNSSHGVRALALLQFGLIDWAEQELIFLATDKGIANISETENEKQILDALLYMAQRINMPALSLKLAGQNGKYYGLSHLSYPVFWVELDEGYNIDPALLLAIMRRESLFFSGAESTPGARGLMQVMPATADVLVKRYNLDYSGSEYFSPKASIDLGQKYVRNLIANPNSSGNLIYVIAGYNGGFFNVERWKVEKHRRSEDPVFFIESIPYYETRGYVKAVMTDYWIYQTKLGIEPYTLNLLAQGDQPFYYDLEQDKINEITKFKYANSGVAQVHKKR